jgi:hypothetical protein
MKLAAFTTYVNSKSLAPSAPHGRKTAFLCGCGGAKAEDRQAKAAQIRYYIRLARQEPIPTG